jgi:4-diphosphocytidyl-2-C-methyl-D-erythritol kinase
MLDIQRSAGLPGGGACTVECIGMTLPESNTLTKAYEGFCAATGVSEDVTVRLEKRIPAGAGLGGGSTDAASFIKALDALFETHLDDGQFMRIAENVGSDVFFFLTCGEMGAAVVTGRGECVRPIAPRGDLFFVLVCPNVHVSTAEAYCLVDAHFTKAREKSVSEHTEVYLPQDVLENGYYANVRTWRFVNSFTEPLTQRYPEIAEAIADLKNAGSLFTQMSGSGSAVFGVFESFNAAKGVAAALAKKWEKGGKVFFLNPAFSGG